MENSVTNNMTHAIRIESIIIENTPTQINHDNRDTLIPYLGWFKRKEIKQYQFIAIVHHLMNRYDRYITSIRTGKTQL